LKHIVKNPRLFKLMFWIWNKHFKWATRKVRRSYLSCLQLARSRGVYIKLWGLLGSIMDWEKQQIWRVTLGGHEPL
jgi:hypothetical protein